MMPQEVWSSTHTGSSARRKEATRKPDRPSKDAPGNKTRRNISRSRPAKPRNRTRRRRQAASPAGKTDIAQAPASRLSRPVSDSRARTARRQSTGLSCLPRRTLLGVFFLPPLLQIRLLPCFQPLLVALPHDPLVFGPGKPTAETRLFPKSLNQPSEFFALRQRQPRRFDFDGLRRSGLEPQVPRPVRKMRDAFERQRPLFV